MRSIRNLCVFGILLLAALGLVACVSSEDEAKQAAAAQSEAWVELQKDRAELNAKRQELGDLGDRIAGKSEDGESEDEGGAAAEGEGEGEETMSPEEQLASLEQEVDKLGENLIGKLTDFINSQEIFEGEPLTEIQRAAFDMKADEDILVAQEYIDKAGNYQKAIDIYTIALISDPTSEKLLAAKASSQELRFMSEERLSRVEKNMTPDEVRALLGTPKRSNVREYEKRGVTAWFYPKQEPKTAAGVFFRKRKGNLLVYEVDFNAIETTDEEG